MFGIRKMKEDLADEKKAYSSVILDIAYLKATTEVYQKSVRELQDKNKKLEDRIWLLENPPKYKVGQVVKGMIVTSVEVVDGKDIKRCADEEFKARVIKAFEGTNSRFPFSVIFEKYSQKQKCWQYKAIKKGMTEPIEIL